VWLVRKVADLLHQDPTFVATRGDLNLVEQVGIDTARAWAVRTSTARTTDLIPDEQFARHRHRRMYEKVRRWAGVYRTSGRNIGIDPTRIQVAVRDLADNARCWVAPATTWISPELACLRVHHQMVAIHPFPNGNGRHA
jgi:fido (protein-threonine AMPylation protein)